MARNYEEFPTVLGEAWGFIKSDGSFTGNDLKRWTESLDDDLARAILRAIIQTAWEDYGGRLYLEQGKNV